MTLGTLLRRGFEMPAEGNRVLVDMFLVVLGVLMAEIVGSERRMGSRLGLCFDRGFCWV